MNRESGPQLAVVIPAYRPSGGLVDLVRTLTQAGTPPIVIVDDGSGPEFRSVFDAAAAFPGVQLLRHAVNLGKGAALKTAFNHVLCSFPRLVGVVTADADGQHHPEDILRVTEAMRTEPGALILGSRSFDQDVPLRSRFGNIATRGIMHALLGQKLTDTQTGLRGIPASLLPRLLRLEASGYEFELEMLIAAHQLSMTVSEVPIRTIYEPGNKSSHFNPIIDSMKIYFVLLRFGSVSMLTALLDNLVFYLAWHRSGNIIASQLLGRVVAVCFNYSMVRKSVFYSHQGHKKVLPKYLLLVLVSGTASYGAIQFLNQRLGMNPVSAKLLAETVLFFVNFAVQRMFIFKPQEGAVEERRTTPMLVFSALVAVVFAILIGVEGSGFAHSRLFSQEIWFPVGWHRFTRYGGAFLLLAAPLLLMAPWSFAGLLCLLILALTVVSVGPLPVLATAFFLLACCSLGCRLLGRGKQDSMEQHLCATLLGAGVYIFLMTFLARLPVNYPWVWGVLLVLPILADVRGTGRRASYWLTCIRKAELRSSGERAAVALLFFILIAQWFVALKPESGTDALAVHLAVPMNIAAHHQMTYQPERFLWSVMPMGADWTYSIVYLLGGEYATRLLNFALLLVVVGLIYGATRRFVSSAAAVLLAASFAATPAVQVVTGSLFVENLLAGLILGMMVAIWRFGETGEKRYLYLAMALGGTALTTKLGAGAFVLLALPFVIAEIVRHWKLLGRRPAAVCTLAVLLLLATALPTYAIAYRKTGNPVFPFLNQKFPSPLLDPNLDLTDARYRIPLDWSVLYTLTFRSSEAWEGQDGSFGFQYLLMAPLALIGLLVVAKRPAQSGAVLSLGAALVIMRSQPNIRYLYAAMPMLLVPFAGLLDWLHTNQRWMYRVLLTWLVAATAINLWFLPSGSYYHKEFCLRFPFSRAERERYRGEAAPIREVVAWYNQHHPSSTVLLTGESVAAGLEGTVYLNHWHQSSTQRQLERAVTVSQMFQLLKNWKVEYFLGAKPEPGDDLKPAALRAFLAACTVPEFEYRNYYLARLEPDCDTRDFDARTPAEPSLAVTEGFYDDFDPAILMRGDWTRDKSFAGPDRHTITYTDVPGAEVSMAFYGKSLFYLFTKAPNRGIARVTIDGKDQGPVDLYAPDIQWQSRIRFCCFGPGKHVVVVRVTGERNPQSSAGFVDLDSFLVQ